MERRRNVTWSDPAETAAWVGTMSGLEFLRTLIEKRKPPPIAVLLGFDLVEVGEGRAVFEVKPEEFHYNPTGQVHGGLAATVLDSALGCAVLSAMPAGVGYTTVELHVNLVRGISKDTPRLRAEATLLHKGRTVCTAQATLKDAAGKLYAHATTTCAVLDLERVRP